MSNNTTTKQETVTVLPLTFAVGKGSKQTETPTVNLSRFTSEIGALLRKYPHKFTLRILGNDVNVPAETASNSPLHRTYAVLRQLTKIIFEGSEGEAAVKGENEKAILQSFQAVGFKFTSFCKASVNEALNLWWKNKQAKIALIVTATRKQNAKLMAETAAIRSEVKLQRIELAAEITGLQVAAEKTAKKLVLLSETVS